MVFLQLVKNMLDKLEPMQGSFTPPGQSCNCSFCVKKENTDTREAGN